MPQPLLDRSPPRQERPRWRLRVLTLSLLLLAPAIWLAAVAGGPRVPRQMAPEIDHWLVRAGLGIDQISVAGHRFTPEAEIFAAIGADGPISLASFDVAAAEERLRQLPWIDTVRIDRIVPDGLAVTVAERVPVAVWRHERREHLIDRTGRILGVLPAGSERRLPVVLGAGAHEAIDGLLRLRGQSRDMWAHVASAERVAGRRWTLHLDSGTRILLPETGEEEALARLAWLAARHGLLEKPLAAIDLRLPQVTLRVRPAGVVETPRSSPTLAHNREARP